MGIAMICRRSMGLVAAALVLPSLATAQSTGVIDPGRVEERTQPLPEATEVAPPAPTPAAPAPVDAPPGSEQIQLKLEAVTVEGATVYSEKELSEAYAEELGKYITLDKVWVIAQRITDRYQRDGYFLTRAIVPPQELDAGRVTIRVIEGYVEDVQLDPEIGDNRLVVALAKRIEKMRPVSTEKLESVLMRMNDIPGMQFRSVLEKKKDADNTGAVTMVLMPVEEHSTTQIGIDNFGSRYLGPWEGTISHQRSLIDGHETQFTVLAGSQKDELLYGSLGHRWMFLPDWTLDMNVSRTNSEPGFTLEPQAIDSKSFGWGFGVSYQVIRQRQENMSVRVAFDARDTESDIFDGLLPITRDRVRAARAILRYETADRWAGYNLGVITFSQGLEGFNASEAGDANLSRAEADPDFRKVELVLSRLQGIDNDWNMLGTLSGQYAGSPLYSSEEFGYGGQAFGRAYDSSEITGDQGIAAALEIRYNGIPDWAGFSASPYGFYDIGAVWNEDTGSQERISGSSTGLGVRVSHTAGLAANVGVAFPLTKEVDAPLHSSNKKSPRYLVQLTYSF